MKNQVEKIKQTVESALDKKFATNEFLAQELFAQNVRVLPLNIGATVYVPCGDEENDWVDEYKVVSICEYEDGFVLGAKCGTLYFEFAENEIGHSVFLTEAEAENFNQEHPCVEKFIETKKLEAKALGAELSIEDDTLIDYDHRDSFWYGGEIASISYKNYTVSIRVHGEVCMSVYSDTKHYHELFCYTDKSNKGAYSDENALKFLKDDATIQRYDDAGKLYWVNNNWVELFIYDENDEDVTHLSNEDSVLGYDVFDALNNIKDYIADIDRIIAKTKEAAE